MPTQTVAVKISAQIETAEINTTTPYHIKQEISLKDNNSYSITITKRGGKNPQKVMVFAPGWV